MTTNATNVMEQEVSAPEKLRYSDEELNMFKEVILKKLDKAKEDYEQLRAAITHSASNDVEDTSPNFKILEDGASQLSKEESVQSEQIQSKFIQSLSSAFIRIEH